jgi:hypothetical protein
MSISSISSSPPPVQIKAPEAGEPKGPDVKVDGDDASASQQTVQAPLPPGQGTRVDQIA